LRRTKNEEELPSYISPTVDALNGIENVHDVDSIFELLRITLIFAEDGLVSYDTIDATFGNDHSVNETEPNSFVDNSVKSNTKSVSGGSEITNETVQTEKSNVSEGFLEVIKVKSPSALGGDTLEDSILDGSDSNNVGSGGSGLNGGGSMTITNADGTSYVQSSIDLMTPVKDVQYVTWIKIRHGMVTDRIDSERLRLSYSMSSLDLSTAAVDKHWSKLQRKIESESFLFAHLCQWKLGVAHEVNSLFVARFES